MPDEDDANQRNKKWRGRTDQDQSTPTSPERHSHWVIAVLGTAQVVLGLLLSLAGFTGSLLSLALGVVMMTIGAFVLAVALAAAFPESKRRSR